MKENMNNAINFLIFNYFGIIPSCKWKDIVRAAIIRAYDDATMQGAYNAIFTKDIDNLDNLKEESDRARRAAAKFIEEKVYEFFGKKEKDDYTEWHIELCDQLKKIYKKVTDGNRDFFSFGNAQKWVNMTIKYIYILDALCANKSEFHERIEKYSKNFDVPIDRYIIEEVWDKQIRLPVRDEKQREQKYGEEKVKAWSTWERSDYENCREDLKKYISEQKQMLPLDWENTVWIGKSYEMKEKEGKSLEKKISCFFEGND